MEVSHHLLVALVLVALTQFTAARSEDRRVSTNGTSDPVLDMLDREREAVDERTAAINENIRTMRNVDMDRDMDTVIPVDVEEERKKKKRKGKGRKKNRKNRNKRKNKKMWPENDLAVNDVAPEYPVADHHSGYPSSGYYSPYNPVVSTLDMSKFFDVQPLDKYLETCDDCYEKIDYDQNLCPMHSPAIELKKWAEELEDVLSHGCAKPENCDKGETCCLARQAPFAPLIVRMSQMMKDVFHMVQSNCKEGCAGKSDPQCTWSDWSPCSRSCGGGKSFRKEICSGRGDLGGRVGQKEEMDCNTDACPVCEQRSWSTWQSWGDCSVSCGSGGYRTRLRRCVIKQYGQRCGMTCEDSPQLGIDKENCDKPDCQNCRWSSWNSWSQCSESCGQGTKDRYRICTGGHDCLHQCKPGNDREQETCQDNPESSALCRCEQSNWGVWSRWSPCSQRCGPGEQTRHRTCERMHSGKDCGPSICGRIGAKDYDTPKRCEEAPCKCERHAWSSWSEGSCSRTCGLGEKTRTRQCRLVEIGDKKCLHEQPCLEPQRQDENVACNNQECCEPPEWASWGSWSECPVSCGLSRAKRFRECNRSGNSCGRYCIGQEMQDRSCGTPTEVGSWLSWESWSRCSETCGGGNRKRTRECSLSTRSRNACSVSCIGPDTEGDRCNHQPCCEVASWASWSSWTECSKSCDGGTSTRSRKCNRDKWGQACSNNPLNTCGVINKVEQDTKRCGMDPCQCEVREWTSWTTVGACSRTCGDGTKQRSRYCRVTISGKKDCYNSRMCAEGKSDYDTEDCNERPCQPCEVKKYMSWESWSTCSRRCGLGTRTRTRRCRTEVVGRDCGYSECQKDDGTTEDCMDREVDHPDCIKYAYGEWKEWCPCDCTNGLRSRRRECEKTDGTGKAVKVDINNCIAKGEARESDQCDVLAVCPGCISTCTGMVDGDYQSCSGCKDYITCTNGKAKLTKCAHTDTEYDSFIKKCVQAPSPSCSLQRSYEKCDGLPDGTFPYKGDDKGDDKGHCGKYLECTSGRTVTRTCNKNLKPRPGGVIMEYNHFTKQCMRVVLPLDYDVNKRNYINSPPGSPTCTRILITVNFATITTGISINNTIPGASGVQRDAPADMYYDETHGLNAEERRLQYEREVVEKRQREAKDAARAKMLETELKINKATLSSTTLATDGNEKENPDCVTDCEANAAGLYASCRGCRYYAICTKHGQFREWKCPRGKQFDSSLSKCVKNSTTCRMRRR